MKRKKRKVVAVIKKFNPLHAVKNIYRMGYEEGKRGDPLFSGIYRPIIKKVKKVRR